MKSGQIFNLRQLAQEALDNWDAEHMTDGEVKYLRHLADTGDEQYEISEVTARSYKDEWDMLAEYAESGGANY